MLIVTELYNEIVEELEKNATKGWNFHFRRFSDRKEYYDVILSPALHLIKKRFEEDGFTVERFQEEGLAAGGVKG